VRLAAPQNSQIEDFDINEFNYAAIAGMVNSYLEVLLEPIELSRQADEQNDL